MQYYHIALLWTLLAVKLCGTPRLFLPFTDSIYSHHAILSMSISLLDGPACSREGIGLFPYRHSHSAEGDGDQV